MSRGVLDDVKYRGSATSPLPDVELPGQRVQFSTLQTVVLRYVVAGEMATGQRALELGCGPGLGLGYLRECGAREVVGADRDAVLLGMARERALPCVGLVQCDASRLPFRDAAFDVVFLLEMLMYFADPIVLLRESRRVLRSGGSVLLTAPNGELVGGGARGGVVHFYSCTEMLELLEDAGFRAEVFGAFPVGKGARQKSTCLRMASRVLDALEMCGLPHALRMRITGTVLGKDSRLPFRVESSHRDLLSVGDGSTLGLIRHTDGCRVLYACGVAA